MREFLGSREDLTGKARIRNAALELFAAQGVSNTTMRQVADAAGVTPGLVVHHFESKEGLHRAVDRLLMERVSHSLEGVTTEGTPQEVAQRRNESIGALFVDNPVLVDYLRRSLLENNEASDALFDRLLEFSRTELRSLREAGVSRSDVDLEMQSLGVMLRMLGPLLLQPLVDHIERYTHKSLELENGDGGPSLPTIEVVVHYPSTDRSGAPQE